MTAWLTTEIAILRSVYPAEGSAGVQARLPNRGIRAIRQRAREEGVRFERRVVLSLENLPRYCREDGGCLIWRLGCNSGGYPIAHINGKGGKLVRRHVFLDLLGRRLTKGQRVGTRCGHKLCLAPACLCARTVAQDGAARKKVLPATYRAIRAQAADVKLDMAKARAIRADESSTLDELAARYQCHKKTIWNAKAGKTWPDATNGSSVFGWRP